MRTLFLPLLFLLNLAAPAQSFEELQDAATACFKQEDYDCTIKNLRKALKKDPTHAKAAVAWADIGTSLRRTGKREEAMEAYNEALRISPEHVKILMNRASLKRQQGDLQGSLTDYGRVIGLAPENSEAYMERANTKERLGDTLGEEADLVQAVKVAPKDHKVAVNLARLKKRTGRFDEARADLDRIIAEHPEEPIPYNNRADLLVVTNGDLEQALRDVQKAIELKPDYGNAYVTRAEIALAQGRKADAKADLDKAVDVGEKKEGLAELYEKCK